MFSYFSIKTICCEYSLEVSHWGTSNEYPQNIYIFIKELEVIIRELSSTPPNQVLWKWLLLAKCRPWYRPRPLLFGMQLYLVDLYQYCSDCSHGGQKWSRPSGHLFYIDSYRENTFKIFFSETKSKPNFIWSLHGPGEQKFVRHIWGTWSRWQLCPYMIKTP